MHRLEYSAALRDGEVLEALAAFAPRVAGTPPLRLHTRDSDIDILCHAPDLISFAAHVWKAFSDGDGFSMHQWTGADRPVIAAFRCNGWTVQLFGSTVPVAEQDGWRHFEVERRLLRLGGESLRDLVMRRRLGGMKTEAAFADVLSLRGDPHDAVLALEGADDEALRALISQAIHQEAEQGQGCRADADRPT